MAALACQERCNAQSVASCNRCRAKEPARSSVHRHRLMPCTHSRLHLLHNPTFAVGQAGGCAVRGRRGRAVSTVHRCHACPYFNDCGCCVAGLRSCGARRPRRGSGHSSWRRRCAAPLRRSMRAPMPTTGLLATSSGAHQPLCWWLHATSCLFEYHIAAVRDTWLRHTWWDSCLNMPWPSTSSLAAQPNTCVSDLHSSANYYAGCTCNLQCCNVNWVMHVSCVHLAGCLNLT